MKFPEDYRLELPPDDRLHSEEGDPFGAFSIPAAKGPCRRRLRVIACDGAEVGWEHVSVSVDSAKCPTWEEMCFIKDLFWNKDEWVIQFHPNEKDYINIHPGVLHLWKPVNANLPTPPKICV